MSEFFSAEREIMLSLLGVAIATAATPGPNNLLVLSMSAVHGLKKAFGTYLGICLGFPFMVFCVAGIVHVFGDNILQGLEFVKWLGAAFLMYIALKLFMAAPSRNDTPATNAAPVGFWKVVLLQWINPKAWGMAASTTVLAGKAWILPPLIYQVVIFPAVGIWYLGGNVLRQFVIGTRYETYLNKVMAILLMLSVVMILR